ncbi:MAG TPA: oligosaccharide flippase family protein [Candidatus Paceibacterota bacterium]|nr:oligosaccharide flippase family protein [Candidatus Paceibacterota bacterium]
MTEAAKQKLMRLLRWSEQYTRTDMVYLATSGFWLTVGQVGAIIFSLALAIIFGHFATQDTYGNYKYVINIGSLLSALSLSGMGTAVTRASAQKKDGVLSQGFRLNLQWSFPMVIAGLFASAYYYHAGNTFAGSGIALVSIILPIINSFTLYDQFLIGKREFRLDVLFSVGSLAVTTSLIGITLLYFSQRAIVLIGMYLLANLATDMLWFWITKRKAQNSEEDPELLNYSFHLSVMSIVGAIADKIDSIAIFTLLGPAQLAVYSYAIAMPEQIKGVVKNVAAASLPKFAKRPISEIKETIDWRLMQFVAILTVIAAVYVIICPLLFKYLFPVYVASIGYSQLYVLSIVFVAIINVLIAILESHQKVKQLYYATNVAPVILIITLPVLTFYWGVLGAVVAQIIYRVTNAAVAYWQFASVSSEAS